MGRQQRKRQHCEDGTKSKDIRSFFVQKKKTSIHQLEEANKGDRNYEASNRDIATSLAVSASASIFELSGSTEVSVNRNIQQSFNGNGKKSIEIGPNLPALSLDKDPTKKKPSAPLIQMKNNDKNNDLSFLKRPTTNNMNNNQRQISQKGDNALKAKRKLFQSDIQETVMHHGTEEEHDEAQNGEEGDSSDSWRHTDASSPTKNLLVSSASSSFYGAYKSDKTTDTFLETPTLISSESCSASNGTRSIAAASTSLSCSSRTDLDKIFMKSNGNINTNKKLKQHYSLSRQLSIDTFGTAKFGKFDDKLHSSARGMDMPSSVLKSSSAFVASGNGYLPAAPFDGYQQNKKNDGKHSQPASFKKVLSLRNSSGTLLTAEPNMANPKDTQRLLRIENEREAASCDILLQRLMLKSNNSNDNIMPEPSSVSDQHDGKQETDAEGAAYSSSSSMLDTLNERQRYVAEHSPYIGPLSVMAGAGSGKTHTMIARAIQLTQKYDIQPQHILMLTFTVRAANEMKERLALEFVKLAKQNQQRQQIDNCNNESSSSFSVTSRLPYAKTFHSLALYWIRRCWRSCKGMTKSPSLLTTQGQQRQFMKYVIEEHVRDMQLNRCCQFLNINIETSTWHDVIHSFEKKYPIPYTRAHVKAEEKLQKLSDDIQKEIEQVKKSTTTKKKKKQSKQEEQHPTLKTDQEIDQERKEKAAIDDLLQRTYQKDLVRECYYEILSLFRNNGRDIEELNESPAGNVTNKNNKDKEKRPVCDFETLWKADRHHCDMYLKLVKNGRLGQHSPNDYLEEDAIIWQKYEHAQIREGQIDFDNMLSLFIQLLNDNVHIRDLFFATHRYVIVDEFQDNSQVQSELLMNIVQNGQITVVGDDDQCIYEFRGASVGNFERFKQYFLKQQSNNNYDSSISSAIPQHGSGLEEDMVAEEIYSRTSFRVEERMLIDNYRSSGNILRVASVFLKECHHKRNNEKNLIPTKDDGKPVELWACYDPKEQATHIVNSLKERHDTHGVPYKEMACLFRCFKMGGQGQLHSALQLELVSQKIPFQVTGGATILESEVVKDLLSYLSLICNMNDDESFCRIFNKPPRRLSKKVLEKITEHQTLMQTEMRQVEDATSAADASTLQNTRNRVGLEEAANNLCILGVGLSKAQCKALMKFLQLLQQFRTKGMNTVLSELLVFLWEGSGLEEWHIQRRKTRSEAKKKKRLEARLGLPRNTISPKKKNDDDESDDTTVDHDENNGECSSSGEDFDDEEKKKYLPPNVRVLIQLSEKHVDEWKEREALVEEREKEADGSNVPSLYELSRKVIIDHTSKLPLLPQEYLPSCLLNELYSKDGRGVTVIKSFLSDLIVDGVNIPDYQGNTRAASREQKNDDKVSISTIHRAKGLEWDDVYVPYFNDGYMPTNYRGDYNDDEGKVRHREGCSIRKRHNKMSSSTNTGKLERAFFRCTMQCAKYFQEQDASSRCASLKNGGRPLTPEERHMDEERRLAHVAATRARNHLVFLSIQQARDNDYEKVPTSKFQNELLKELSSSVFCHKSKIIHKEFYGYH